MTFKKWLQMVEGLTGPGGGGTMDSAVGSVERMAKAIAAKGAGAFHHINRSDNPPDNGPVSPDANYYPSTRKMKSKKRMKKS